MCCRPEWINAGLPILRETYDGPFGAYPNIGYNPEAPINSSQGEDILLHDQYDRNNYTPSKLAGVAGEWKEMGAQVIGGCCSTGPEHIMAMRNTVKG